MLIQPMIYTVSIQLIQPIFLSVKAESENGTITVKSIGDSEWSVNDMDASEIDSSKAGALVGTISTLSSKTRLKKNPVDLSQYGL